MMEDKHVIIIARCVTALIRAMGMQAANSQTPTAQPYVKEDFDNVILEEGTSWNSVCEVLYP